MNKNSLLPFLKWPGGKRWFISRYSHLLPVKYNRYIEPFVGGGAVFFSLNPKKSIISDINPDLINVYSVMRDKPEELKKILIIHQKMHCKDYFYEIRSDVPPDNIMQAGRFLYLNRACFNGLYRVNASGEFNVPMGNKTNFLYDIDMFDTYSKALKYTDIYVEHYSKIIKKIRKNDFIFIDPPYTILHNQNSFIKYNEKLFSWSDQEQLLKDLCAARNKGAIVFAANANFPPLKAMYEQQNFYTKIISRPCVISGKPEGRKKQEELLITSIPLLEG